MRFTLKNIGKPRRARSANAAAGARTLSVAAQMAMLCPSGMDAWMQREIGAGFEVAGRGLRR